MMVRLFGVDIPNPNVELEETKRTKKRKTTRLFGQEIVPARRKSAIKKTRSSSPPLSPAPLPFPLAQMIHNMEGKDLLFVIRKILERSDTAIDQNRFFVPKSEVLWGLLSEAEKTAVKGGGGLGVVVVDPRGGKYDMKLKYWKSLNMIVLNSSGWREFIKDNELKAEVDCAEVWCFRAESKLCLAFNVKRQLLPVINI